MQPCQTSRAPAGKSRPKRNRQSDRHKRCGGVMKDFFLSSETASHWCPNPKEQSTRYQCDYFQVEQQLIPEFVRSPGETRNTRVVFELKIFPAVFSPSESPYLLLLLEVLLENLIYTSQTAEHRAETRQHHPHQPPRLVCGMRPADCSRSSDESVPTRLRFEAAPRAGRLSFESPISFR